jgi:hypothetical protein
MRHTGYHVDEHGNVVDKYDVPVGAYVDLSGIILDHLGLPSGYYFNSEGKIFNREGQYTGFRKNAAGAIFEEFGGPSPLQPATYQPREVTRNVFPGGLKSDTGTGKGYPWA